MYSHPDALLFPWSPRTYNCQFDLHDERRIWICICRKCRRPSFGWLHRSTASSIALASAKSGDHEACAVIAGHILHDIAPTGQSSSAAKCRRRIPFFYRTALRHNRATNFQKWISNSRFELYSANVWPDRVIVDENVRLEILSQWQWIMLIGIFHSISCTYGGSLDTLKLDRYIRLR